MKISTKLVTTFLSITLLLLGTGGIVTDLHVRSALTAQALEHLQAVAGIQKNRLEALMRQNLERLSLIASRTQLRLSLAAYLADADPNRVKRIRNILDDAVRSIEDIESITLLDLAGRVAVSTDPARDGGDESGQEYFRSGLTDKRADLLSLDTRGHLKLHLSGPLMLDGEPIGIVVVDAKAETLLQMTRDYSGLGKTGETVLVGPAVGGGYRYLTPLRFDAGAALRAAPAPTAHPRPAREAMNGHEGVFASAIDYRGATTLAATRYLAATGWALAVKIDTAEALAPLAELRSLLALTLAALAVGIVIAAIGVARVISRPMETIARQADEIGSGRYGRVVSDGLKGVPSEIASLARSIDRMSTALQEQERARRQAQQAVLQNERFLDAIVENIPNMIFVKDAEALRFVRINRAGEQLLGYPRESLIGRNDYDFFPPHEAEFFVAKDREVLRSGQLLDVAEEPVQTAHQGTRILHTMKLPIPDDSGNPLYLLGISEDITERRAAEQALLETQKKLESLAYFDALTRLPNRRLLDDRIHRGMAATQRRGKLLAVCYLDLDGFKPINDGLGHDVGDQVLVQVAERLRKAVRTEDTVARWGGDEFALLLTELDSRAKCFETLDRLIQALAQPYELEAGRVELTASIGVTLFPEDPSDADTLLRHADQALYKAKEKGRNRYDLFDGPGVVTPS